MKRIIVFIGLVVCIVLFESCQRGTPVTLTVDFSSRDIWNYEFTCDIGGNFLFEDSTSTLNSTINCILTGSGSKEQDYVNIKAERIDITSNILDEIEMMNMEELISDAVYTISLKQGFPEPSDSTVFSFAGFGEWDLHRHLVKIIPTLPEKQIRPGFSWDRERRFPISTSQGKATCEIYQAFTFDSVRTTPEKGQKAYISWLFRYTIDDKQFDTASLIDRLPLKGNGKGMAVMDIGGKCLVKAEMVFRMPDTTLPNISVNWTERASLLLVQ